MKFIVSRLRRMQGHLFTRSHKHSSYWHQLETRGKFNLIQKWNLIEILWLNWIWSRIQLIKLYIIINVQKINWWKVYKDIGVTNQISGFWRFYIITTKRSNSENSNQSAKIFFFCWWISFLNHVKLRSWWIAKHICV